MKMCMEDFFIQGSDQSIQMKELWKQVDDGVHGGLRGYNSLISRELIWTSWGNMKKYSLSGNVK